MSGPPTSDLLLVLGGVALAGHLLGAAGVLAVRDVGARDGWVLLALGLVGPVPVTYVVLEARGFVEAALVGAVVAAALVSVPHRWWPGNGGDGTDGTSDTAGGRPS
jgi:hypothetical protein